MKKEELFSYVDSIAPEVLRMSDAIYDAPELAFEEHKASAMLEDYLERAGFAVERGVGGIATAFRAVYERGEGGPSIGLLCEYDALRDVGHACGHHMQGPAICACAAALKARFDGAPYKLVVYGTPAEEAGGGKIVMKKNGCFDDIDVALMFHGGDKTCVDVKSLANTSYIVTFHGRSAHAAMAPENGRSALDAVLLACQGVEFLREHVRDDVRMHYTIVNAGGPSNVVPERAVGQYELRSYSRGYLDTVAERFKDIIKGAALMTGTTYEIEVESEYKSKIPCHKLNDVLMANAGLVDAPCIRPPREKTGSTDFAEVMYYIPGGVIRVAFVDEGSSAHSEEFLRDGKSARGHNAVLYAAKILAGTAYDIVMTPGLLGEIQKEFALNKARDSAN